MVDADPPVARVTRYGSDATGRRTHEILPDPDGPFPLKPGNGILKWSRAGQTVAPLGCKLTLQNDSRTILAESHEVQIMLKSVKGVCRNGRIELLEPPPEGGDGEVIVTFLGSSSVHLAERGISEQQAANLRHRLATFAEDWERPEMDAYDAL